MSRILQLTDGRFVLGQETFTEAEIVDRYSRGSAVVVRDEAGAVRVLRRWASALGIVVDEVLAVGPDADPKLVAEVRMREAAEGRGLIPFPGGAR